MLELDNWIEENVIPDLPSTYHRPTVNAIGAMEALKKCAEQVNVTICQIGAYWNVVGKDYSEVNRGDSPQPKFFSSQEETLELAICQFSRKLFAK